MNGTMIGSCDPKNCLMSSSRLPSIAPARIGAITDTIVSQGMTARPAPTKISIVRNGPGFDALHDVGARVLLVAHHAGQREEHPAVGVAHRDHHRQRAEAEHAAVEVVGDREREERGRADLGGQDAAAAQQHARRGAEGHFRADGEEIHPQHCRVADSGQCLSKAANPQQVREERVEDHAEEQRHHHQSAGHAIDRLEDFHGGLFYLR